MKAIVDLNAIAPDGSYRVGFEDFVILPTVGMIVDVYDDDDEYYGKATVIRVNSKTELAYLTFLQS